MPTFRLFAGTDVGLRDNNEDNFTVCQDLTKGEWIIPSNQQENITLGSRGSLMVVADGMGGMNAGEVASDIAIKTIQTLFSPTKMPAHVTKSPDSIKAYIKKTIIEADRQVKKPCKEDPTTEGMGSTVVMAWFYGGNVYVGWMGDSRAYSYIPEKGISRLSKDHSYVQELVDAKMITEEEAMLHPQSNVIMRSLGDVSQKAKPDVICHPVSKDEIILLCSDGLCGVCTDESIAEIISQTSNDLRNCKEALTNAALEADGSDNITIALMQIVDISLQMTGGGDSMYRKTWLTWQNGFIVLFAVALLVSLGVVGYKSCGFTCSQNSSQDAISIDTLSKKVVAEDSASNKETNSDSTEVEEHQSSKRVITFKEKGINGEEEGSNSSVEVKDSTLLVQTNTKADPVTPVNKTAKPVKETDTIN